MIEGGTTKSGEFVEFSDFTILVGPNNTGKSQTLRDIREIMTTSYRNEPETILIQDIDLLDVTFDEFVDQLDETVDQRGRTQFRSMGPEVQGYPAVTVKPAHENKVENADSLFELEIRNLNFRQFAISYLDAGSRLEIAESTNSYDVESDFATDPVQKLYEEEEARKEMRAAFKQIFNKDVILDIRRLQKFQLLVHDEFGDVENNLIGPNDEIEDYRLLDKQGAGYRSLAGVVLSLLLSQNRTVLLDEPEAFLHPAQAREFGGWLADHVDQIPGQVIISTHNSNFLRGAFSSSPDITVHRLNRRDDQTTFNEMSIETTQELSSDPLLSSQRVIEGIFHEGVVVCEADSDATVYRFVASENLDERDILYTYGQNKQTIKKITTVLTEADIPSAAIVDLDIIRNPQDLVGLVRSYSSHSESQPINRKCDEINTLMGEDDYVGPDWEELKDEGVAAASGEVENLIGNIIDDCKKFGIFIVPVGELEEWIDLGVRKNRWVGEALEEINESGGEPELTEFVRHCHDYLREEYQRLVMPE
ncbi:ATP-dependent nuclease [Natronorubrum sulfidifaciens]|uniref:ATP-dependent nuclease n=1 Tax=Natronorubrum sulfidifaciens TaxID=388259 RepID=UPI000A01CEAA|nr:AAA family ATPase [Natronorubrum sulfidifaciens]